LTPPHVSIHSRVISEIEHHCRKQLPREGCGILAGQDCEITHFFPIPNQDENPRSFSFDPQVFVHTLRRMRELHLSWLGILHSHPRTAPYPSRRDIHQWQYPDLTSWILSLHGNRPALSAFWIQNGRVIPVLYQVIADRMKNQRS
jgi:[CysO sulfur-carrier protein]-S-L-cysteine hydrolase